MRAFIAAAVIALSGSVGAAQSPDDVTALKKDVAALKASVAALKKEVAALAAASPVKKPNFPARLAAATSLSTATDQQSAFAKIAVEAATWGESKTVYDALGKITSAGVLQDCTYKAAVRLGVVGQEEEAVALAKRLTSSADLQRALLKIARGEGDDRP